MTEDMRERFEKAREDFAAAYNNMHSRCVARAAFMAGWQEAALSSAGTSAGDYDQKSCDVIMNLAMLVRRLCARLHKHEPDAKMIDQALGYLRGEGLQGSILRGDSLSGKGEATKEVMSSEGESANDSTSNQISVTGRGAPSCQQETSASAPDRAEERARALDDEAERIVSNCACATQWDELRDEEHDTYRTMVLNVRSGLQRVVERWGANEHDWPMRYMRKER